MGMTFLAPLFLAGAALLAIPVLIHLTHKERREPVEWPSLMFLQRIEFRAASRQRIRHWLLFALRCAALLLVVMAFARPVVNTGSAAATTLTGGEQEVVILLDRSHSMGLGSRWPRAQEAARDVVRRMGPRDRLSVVLFDDAASAAVTSTGSGAAALAAIDAAKPGVLGTRIAPPIRLASRLLTESPLARREVVLISDFQRRGWPGGEDARLPSRTHLTTVDVASDSAANTAISGVDLVRDANSQRELVTVTARLTTSGAREKHSVAASLLLNGRVAEQKSVELPATGSARVTFAAAPLPAGLTRGEIRLAHDSLPVDDSFFFTVAEGERLPIVIVERDGADPNTSLYLARALAIGDAPGFGTRVVPLFRLTTEDIASAALVILNDAPYPAGRTGTALRNAIASGTGLLVIAGQGTISRRWPGDAASMLPASLGDEVDRDPSQPATIGFLDRSHPALALFSAPRSGDFAAARINRYVATGAALPDARTLVRYDDGAPALLERRAGEGWVLLWTSALDGEWSDLPLQPIFLPFVHQIAKHAAGYAERKRWYTTGDVVELSRVPDLAKSSGAEKLVAEAPSGARVEIAGDSADPTLLVSEQGFYQLKSESGTRRLTAIAANVSAAESDLARVDPEELALALEPLPGDSTQVALAGTLAPDARERTQRLWWYLLAAALLALAAETVLGNRLSRRGWVA
jgi:hypothetical protein